MNQIPQRSVYRLATAFWRAADMQHNETAVRGTVDFFAAALSLFGLKLGRVG